MGFGAMIGHVKIDCTPITSGVLLKFRFRSFLLDREVLWRPKNFLKDFYTLNNPGFLGQ